MQPETDDQSESDDEPNYLKEIENAKTVKAEGTEFSYNHRDVILYRTSQSEDSSMDTRSHARTILPAFSLTGQTTDLGLGAKRTDLPLVFEGSDDFQVLPTFGE